jgi:transcriptional regulator with XRE-family HTH domain
LEIQEIIKARRLELNMSIREVAQQLGVAPSTVSRYESNDIQNMGIDKIEALSKVLKCSPGYLMGWESIPNSERPYSLDYKESKLINIYRTLNIEGKDKLIERADELRSLGYIKEDNARLA